MDTSRLNVPPARVSDLTGGKWPAVRGVE